MSATRYRKEFKIEELTQVTERGHSAPVTCTPIPAANQMIAPHSTSARVTCSIEQRPKSGSSPKNAGLDADRTRTLPFSVH